jgi:ankyrin repeat protein
LKDNAGRTLVWWATVEGHMEVFKLLLDHGGDANSNYNNGWMTALLAFRKRGSDVIKLLLEKGGDASSKAELRSDSDLVSC